MKYFETNVILPSKVVLCSQI